MFRIFHILDSLPSQPKIQKEARQLQNILLKLSPGDFKEGRISLNHAQVVPTTLYHSLNNLSSHLGTLPKEWQGLRVFHHLLCQEVFLQPRGDNEPYQGNLF